MKVIEKDELLDLTTKSGGIFSVNNLDEAFAFCKSVTKHHYENFPVGSTLIPKQFRYDIYSVYSFARLADDISDELKDNITGRINALDKLNEMLSDEFFKNQTSGNPVFIALHSTLNKRGLPILPFQKLLSAFKRDILFKQPINYSDIEEYCKYSANPVGEIILRIFGLHNEKTAILSDYICTGLQFVNFWQDLSIDLQNNRCYIPENILNKYGLTKENLQDKENSAKLSFCLNEIYAYSGKFFESGRELIKYLEYYRLKHEIKATILGGEMVLKKLKNIGSNVICIKPKLSSFDYLRIIISSLLP